MATDFNISPYFDDYFSTGGGLENNYYKVMFKPGRALQARELTTLQSALQNQIATLGRNISPDGASVYGSEFHLNTALDSVRLQSTLSDTSVLAKNDTGDGFKNISVGNSLRGATSGLTAIVKFVSPAEGTDSDMIFVKYVSSNTYSNTSGTFTHTTFKLGESLYISNTTTEIARVGTNANTTFGLAEAVTIDAGIIFTKESFVQTDIQDILVNKFSDAYNARIGYIVTDTFITSTEDSSLNDNAQGYPNYAAPGADRHQINLLLCSLGYASDWVSTDVEVWQSGVVYHKNKKVKLSNTSTEVFICTGTHTTTLANKPVTSTDNNYWKQAVNFIELGRTKNGQWIPKIEASAAMNTLIYNTIRKILENRDDVIHGDFTVKPFGLRVNENDTDGIFLTNFGHSIANTLQLLVSVDAGYAFMDGAEVLTQVPENFVIDKPRTKEHIRNVVNFSPEINYGNYMIVNNLKGYFNFQDHETVTFYSANTSETDWANTGNIIATAKIRYFDINSGRKTVSNPSDPQYPTYRAYLYNFKNVKTGEARSIKGAFGQCDTEITTKAIPQVVTVGGVETVSLVTANVYGELHDAGFENKSVFPLAPGFIQHVYETNSSSTPIFYTIKDFDAQLVKNSGKYELRNPSSNTYFTAADFGAVLGNGLVDPANQVDLAELNYTLYNMSGGDVDMTVGANTFTVISGEMIPEDYIAGESGANYAWNSDAIPKFAVYFPTANTTTLISGINLRVKMGVTNAQADTKTYIPCVVTKVINSANTTNQGYDSNEICLFESDVYKLDAVYMSSTSAEPVLPQVNLQTLGGALLVGETIYEVNANGIKTGITGKLVEFTDEVANTWSFILGAGAMDENYFTANNIVYGEKSKAYARITSGITVNSGSLDITGRYTLDNGQRDNYYDWAKIKLKAGKTAPTNPILVVYSKFDATYGTENEKLFFSVGSYGGFSNTNTFIGNSDAGYAKLSYTELPTYQSAKYGNISLRDCVDFRPLRAANTSVTSNNSVYLSAGTFEDISNIDTNWIESGIKIVNPSPFADDPFKIDYSYFMSRKDSVVINKNKEFQVVKGIPGSITEPVIPDGAMTLWKLFLPPYLDDLSMVQKSFVDNKVYTMKNIGELDTRLSELEKTVKLNTEELKALSEHVPSLSSLYVGLERFKNGILLDTFTGHGVGDVQDTDYRCSIEPDAQVLRSPFESQAIDIDVIAEQSNIVYHPVNSKTYLNDNSETVERKNGIITLPYTHVSFIEQTNFTSSISITPYALSYFIGKVSMDPESDNWFDTTTLPAVEINLEGDADAWAALGSAVNERYVIALSSTPQYAIGSMVVSNDGGSGIVTDIEGSNVVLISYEGKFTIGGTLAGRMSNGTPVGYTINDTWTRGGAPGFGTQFGDWQTAWTGVDKSVDVSSSGTSRTVSDTQTIVYTGYQNYTSSQSVSRTQTGTTTATRTTTNTTTTLSRTGLRSTFNAKVVKTDLGDKVVDVSIVPYIRTKDVLFDATGLKPLTKHIPYFNGVDVSAYCGPRTLSGSIWQLESLGGELFSDESGSIKGMFKIPGGVFATGERKFKLADSGLSIAGTATSQAESTYTASGLQQTKVNQVISTRVPVVEQRSITTDRKTYTSTSETVYSTAWTPLSALPTITQYIPPPDPCAAPGCPCEPCGCGGCPEPEPANIVISKVNGRSVTSTQVVPGNPIYGNQTSTSVSATTPAIGASTVGYTTVTLSNTGGTSSTFVVQEISRPTSGAITLSSGGTISSTGSGTIVGTAAALNVTLAPGESRTISVYTGTAAYATSGNFGIAAVAPNGNQILSIGQTCTAATARDPLAQTFFVEKSETQNGIFLTGVDIFVSKKPSTLLLPLSFDIRSTLNGYPSQTIVPGTSVVYNFSDELYFNESIPVNGTHHNGINLLTVKTVEEHKLVTGQYITLLDDTNYAGEYAITVVDRNTFTVSIPYSSVHSIQPSNTMKFSKINVATADNDWVPTRFVFEYPIYVDTNEYSLIIKSDTEEYECYIAQLGKTSLRDGQLLTKQAYIGSMFMSQNSSTWTPNQESDIAFRIWRAKFDTSIYGDVTFTQNDTSLNELNGIKTTFSNNFDLKYNLMNFQPKTLEFNTTNVDWYIKTSDTAGTLDSAWGKMRPNSDIEFPTPRKISKDSQTVKIRATFNSSSDFISPVIDIINQRAILVENIINNNPTFEYLSEGGAAQAKYISRSVILDEGMDAEDVRVTVNAARPRYNNSESSIGCFMKILASGDEKLFFDRFWYPMLLMTDPGYSSSNADFKKYTYMPVKNVWYVDEGDGTIQCYYTGDGRKFNFNEIQYEESELATFVETNAKPLEHLSYDQNSETLTYTYYDGSTYGEGPNKIASYTNFKQYAVKLVMLSNNSSIIPLIKDLKALALT